MVIADSRRYFYIAISFIVIFVMASIFKINLDKKREELLNAQLNREITVLISRATKSVNVEHLRCLATNIYHEAKSEPFVGQVAVARVVMNRVLHGFGSNPCKVVYQYTIRADKEDPTALKKFCQFSWVCSGNNQPHYNSPRYRQAEEIARQVLLENKWNELIPNNVLFFHSTSVNPGWDYTKVIIIGNHVFYSRGKEKTNTVTK